MRRPLIAATAILVACAVPASAQLPDPWEIYRKYFGECMDCVPQVHVPPIIK